MQVFYEKVLGNIVLLWFQQSNNYSIISKEFYHNLQLFNSSKTIDDFILKFNAENDDLAKDAYNILKGYLSQCNQRDVNKPLPNFVFDFEQRKILRTFSYKDSLYFLYLYSEKVLKFFQPALAHLNVDLKNKNQSHHFDIQLHDSFLCLYYNHKLLQAAPKNEYHLIQGKYNFALLNCIHNKNEQDWIATFHASTIGNGEETVMLVGNSGSGKSTLATLLMHYGYDLIADDISAMLAHNNHIAVLPSAISIKEKAFTVVKSLRDDFDKLPKEFINKTKGNVIYIPPLPLKNPEQLDYPCKKLVLVRYSQKPTPTTLTKGFEQEILEELISESWLAPNKNHAQSFLKWLGTVDFYKLSYHYNEEAITAIGKLF